MPSQFKLSSIRNIKTMDPNSYCRYFSQNSFRQAHEQESTSKNSEKKKPLLSPTARKVGLIWIAFSSITIVLIGFSVKDIIFLDDELSDMTRDDNDLMTGEPTTPHHQPFYQYHFTMPHHLESAIKIVRSFVALGIVVIDYKMNFNKLDGVEGISEEELFEHKSSVHRRSAQRLVQLCLANGGVFIKAGQHVASLNQILPPEFTDGFKPCQDKAPTRPWSVMEPFVREQLTGKKNVEKGCKDPLYDIYFSKIDAKPLAAGSLAQVHVGYLKGSDRKVAIKVQYPDLEGSLSSDSKLLKRLISAAEFAFNDIKLQWICNEFELNLPMELNFLNEAKNCYLLGEKLKTVPRLSKVVRTPYVYWTHCTNKVLTIEFVDGFKVNDIHAMREKGMDIDVSYISYLLSHAFSEQIFSKGFIHSDPHPGNIIVLRNKQTWNNRIELVIIDHGLYHQLDRDFRILYCQLWKSIVDYDEKKLIEISKQLGLTDTKEKENDGPLFAELLKVILTARAHDNNASTDILTAHQQEDYQRKQSKGKLLAYSQKHFMEIVKVLGDLDRRVLLLLKCNDLLRSIQMDLGVPVNYFIIFAQYALDAIHRDRLTKVFEQHRKSGLLYYYYKYMVTKASCMKEYLIFNSRLQFYMLGTAMMGFYQNFRREWNELRTILNASANENTTNPQLFYKIQPNLEHPSKSLSSKYCRAIYDQN